MQSGIFYGGIIPFLYHLPNSVNLIKTQISLWVWFSVSFLAIKNTDEIHSVLSDLIIARQDKSVNNIIKQEIPQSNAEELKKYKDLLDNGIITQEEFDQKKKQLLSL